MEVVRLRRSVAPGLGVDKQGCGVESSHGVLLSSPVQLITRHTVTAHTSFRNAHSYLSGE